MAEQIQRDWLQVCIMFTSNHSINDMERWEEAKMSSRNET